MNQLKTGERESDESEQAERILYRKISWRILPMLMLGYVFAYLDRVNVGYAQLQMVDVLDFGPAVFGLGTGIMFLAYFLFEVPSNMLMERVGARKTFSRIMILWGLAASASMLVTTPAEFYVVRFLLGAFEAGFYPGVILYLTYWYPTHRRGRAITTFSSAAVFASLIAGPLSGATLKYMDQVAGLAGWQWLYLTQGLPAVFLGVAAYVFMVDRPAAANWLTDQQRAQLDHHLGPAPPAGMASSGAQLKSILSMPAVWALASLQFLLLGAQYTMLFWIPSLIKGLGVGDPLHIGLYAALPSISGVVGMLLMGRSSDHWHERRWHFALCAFIAASGALAVTLTQGHLAPSLTALCIAGAGMAALNPLFSAAVSDFLPERVVAPGIALITSCGILGAAASPVAAGFLNAKTGSTTYTLYMVVCLFIVAGAMLPLTLPGRK